MRHRGFSFSCFLHSRSVYNNEKKAAFLPGTQVEWKKPNAESADDCSAEGNKTGAGFGAATSGAFQGPRCTAAASFISSFHFPASV